MNQQSDSPAPARPRMAMLVAGVVVGDSRVEKAAASAVRAGYDVTVVGMSHRSVTPMAQFEGIPLYRIPIPVTRHNALMAWRQQVVERRPDWASLLPGLDASDPRDPSVPGSDSRQATATGLPHADPPARHQRASTAQRAFRRAERALRSRADLVRRRIEDRSRPLVDRVLLSRPGGWREFWPQIMDFEEAFLRVLIELKPDIVHAHDRHPMAAAASYRDLMRERGREVPWVYDAHEWVPGQQIVGPVQARLGWVAAERELIHHADAVIAVTDELAHRMQAHHGLAELPRTAINAPRPAKVPLDPALRLPLRQECGLDERTPLLVYVGRLAEIRGVMDVIDALPHLPGVHAAFVGNDDPGIRARMTDRARSLGVADRVHLKSYVPQDSVSWYILSATLGLSVLHDNPAHRLAVPTKLSEYLHAGLPVVASDLDEQSRFVHEHGLGTTFAPADAQDLARAVRSALEHRDECHASVSRPDFVRSQSWSASEQALTEVWHGLCRPGGTATPETRTAVGSAQDGPERAGPCLGLVGGEEGAHLGAAWRSAGGSVLHAPAPGTEDLSTQLRGWAAFDQQADAVLYQSREPAFGKVEGGFETEVLSLVRRRIPVGVDLGRAPLVDPSVLMEAVPSHAFTRWDADDVDRYRRQLRRALTALEPLRDAGVPLFTHSALAARLDPRFHYVPETAPSAQDAAAGVDRPLGSGRPSTVLVLPAVRSPEEEKALADLTGRLTGLGHSVVRPSRGAPLHPRQAAQADLVIDGMATGEPGEGVAWAWAGGALVVGGMDAGSQLPMVPADPRNLVEVVLDQLSQDSAVRRDLLTSGAERAREQHDGRQAVSILHRVLAV